ncbi:unnamed protein product [Phyllotreta striolata]|uniref:DNA helicase MCM8 n=1 Tax=Phyllotreta striolata TaxID=444603 RepID=A0A9N9TDE7_PHYSR|nr:unnamed protein product [Phyllotreta striolata]
MSRRPFKRYKSNNRAKKYAGNNPSDIHKSDNHGYPGFHLYFPEEGNIDIDELKTHIDVFIDFLERNQSLYSLTDIAIKRFFMLDYKLISEDDNIIRTCPNFKPDFLNNTKYYLKCIGLAMYYLTKKHYENRNQENILQYDVILVRIYNIEPIMQLRDLRVEYMDKLVTIRGTVIKASREKLVSQYLTFSCSNCSGTQITKQLDCKYTIPTGCLTKDCRARSNFKAVLDSPFNRVISLQSIKIQEVLWIEQQDGAKNAQVLECVLAEDLVKTCLPGDDVTVTGIIKAKQINNYNKMKHSIFDFYFEVISVHNNKKQNVGESFSKDGFTFNESDYFEIRKIFENPNTFGLLVNSLCPNIYGHKIVKAGLTLSLFGGAKSNVFRGESHTLIVGDPGLGKSQMLQACASVAPKGIYVCGITSTTTGLTVTVTKDKERGEFSLEAGALVLADQGCCCIDEFDKMPNQHACLLEAMEQQSISVAKAGIVCTLPTRVTILAAANPVGGHYNKGKTVVENLKMKSPMMSRFDLIFILLDQGNEEEDLLVSKHVLGSHSINKSEKHLSSTTNIPLTNEDLLNDTLRGRLRIDTNQNDLIPHSLFRKYIAYALKYVKPTLSEEAKELLKEFYHNLRKQFRVGDSTPITNRQANSLVRLTQARAKVELREVATKQDALDVIEIMKTSLKDVFTDNYGALDKTRSQNGTGTSTKGQITRLLRVLQRVAETETKSIFTIKELKQFSEQVGIAKEHFYRVLDNINLQGYLLFKGKERYQLITASI